MMQSEKVAGDLREAHDVVGGANSVVPALSSAVRRLERRGVQAPQLVEPSVKALDAALNSLEEARMHLDEALRLADFDPLELERIEERLFGLRAAGRKYNTPVDDLAALSAKYTADLELIDAGEERLTALEKSVSEADGKYFAAAAALSKARQKAAAALDKAVNGELKPLKLERATFSTEMVSEMPRPVRTVSIRSNSGYRPIPARVPVPMMKVASGGELARFLLALKVVLADKASAPTLVFDEIDTGVGGAVADAIGMRLGRLGRGVQVLAVTHAPQVAARASRHYVISKAVTDKGKRVATSVTEVAEDKRREEIARMWLVRKSPPRPARPPSG